MIKKKRRFGTLKSGIGVSTKTGLSVVYFNIPGMTGTLQYEKIVRVLIRIDEIEQAMCSFGIAHSFENNMLWG